MAIGERIKALREKHNMNQAELAEEMHVSNKTISSWECSRTEPKMAQVYELCKILDCQCTDIMGEVVVNKPSQKMSLTFEEAEVLTKYRQADESTKNNICKILDIKRGVADSGSSSKAG